MRLLRVALLTVTSVCAALAGGCQQPDVGARCDIAWGTNTAFKPPRPEKIPGDYLETGNLACDSLVCIVSPATSGKYSTCAVEDLSSTPETYSQCGYCSKPCVSDAECFKSATGLVCRQIVLDPAFIKYLEDQDAANGTNVAAQYLGDARYSRYCAAPI